MRADGRETTEAQAQAQPAYMNYNYNDSHMNDWEKGLLEILENVITGIAMGAFLAAFRAVPGMESYFWVIDIVGLVGYAILALAVFKWSIGYILGWAFGAWVLYSAGLMHLEEIMVYIVIPAIILGLRVYLFIKNEN
jgi:hypothetical protein